MSELKRCNGNKILICCFGGMVLTAGLIIPFEFSNYLTSIYTEKCDLIFYIDKKQCCYHKGINEMTNNIDEAVSYLNNLIEDYEKVIFMGTSGGGYASVLFGSLCNKVDYVVSFVPKIKLSRPIDKKYENLKLVINLNTKYILFGDKSIRDVNDNHHISQCEMLEDFPNVTINKMEYVNLKKIRDNGILKKLLDDIIDDKI